VSTTYQSSGTPYVSVNEGGEQHRYRQRSRARPDLARFTAQVDKNRKGAAWPPFWWHPDRSTDPIGTEATAQKFRAKLHKISPLLDIAWDHGENLWAIWVRLPRVRVPWCKGWARLFFVKTDDEFMQLNEIALATVYERDARFQNTDALRYHDRCMAEINRQKQAHEEDVRDEDQELAKEAYRFQQIKTAGYGPSSGDKHHKYHSGS
jgi:hypothetical protein